MSKGQLYKVLNLDGSALYGRVRWPLPTPGCPGRWMPKLPLPLIPCEHGYHLVTWQGILDWLGPSLWIAEPRGEQVKKGAGVLVVQDAGVLVVQQARLLRRVEGWTLPRLVEFAARCAERATSPVSAAAAKSPWAQRARWAANAARGEAEEVRELAGVYGGSWRWAASHVAARAREAAGARAAAARQSRLGAVNAERAWQLQTLRDLVRLDEEA